jgi:hypothetical protein
MAMGGFGDASPVAISHDIEIMLVDACTLTKKIRRRQVVGADAVLLALLGRTGPRVSPDIVAFAAKASADIRRRRYPSPDRIWVPESGESDDVRGLLRETYWEAYFRPHGRSAPYWSVDVAEVVEAAIGRAREQGLSLAGPWQLLDATLMYAPPDVRVLLDRCDTPADRLRSAAQKIKAFGKPPWAYAPAVGLMQYGAGIPAAPDKPIIGSVARQLKSVAALTGGSPMLAVLQFEATRQTIRLGHHNTTTAHVVLAIASFYEQAQLATNRSGLAPYAAAGQVLVECGVDVRRAAHRLPTDVELQLAAIIRSLQIAPGKRPPWTTAAQSVLDAAIQTSHDRPLETHATHLLIAALVDAQMAASQMLGRIGIDVGGLRQRIAGLDL